MGLKPAPSPPSVTRGGIWVRLESLAGLSDDRRHSYERLTCSRGSAMLRQLWTGSPSGAASEPVAASLTIDTTQGLGR